MSTLLTNTLIINRFSFLTKYKVNRSPSDGFIKSLNCQFVKTRNLSLPAAEFSTSNKTTSNRIFHHNNYNANNNISLSIYEKNNYNVYSIRTYSSNDKNSTMKPLEESEILIKNNYDDNSIEDEDSLHKKQMMNTNTKGSEYLDDDDDNLISPTKEEVEDRIFEYRQWRREREKLDRPEFRRVKRKFINLKLFKN